MAEITINITGLNELNTYLVNLPKKLDKELGKVNKNFASFVQKSAKLRAPQGPTGNLKDSISIRGKNDKITISVDSPYAYFQEFGFAPHMIYPNMDNRLGIKLKDLGITHPLWVSHFQPFMQPALEAGLNHLPIWLNQATEKALNG